MRTERVLYDQIYTKLEHQVQENAEEMKQALDEMKKRIKTRDKALDEIGTLRAKLLEQTEALRKDKEELTRLQTYLKEEDEHHFSTQLDRQDQTLIDAHQSVEANSQEMLEEYDDEKMLDEAFDKVKQLTGVDDEDQLIEKLNQIENVNFTRFNYIQSLQAESDILENEIVNATQELEMLHVSDFEEAEKRKEADMMIEKQSELDIKIKEVDLHYKAKVNEFEKIKGSISTACKQLNVPL